MPLQYLFAFLIPSFSLSSCQKCIFWWKQKKVWKAISDFLEDSEIDSDIFLLTFLE